ncbi:MAG: GspE/PulE family protein [Phycisphaerales bacterium JB063]
MTPPPAHNAILACLDAQGLIEDLKANADLHAQALAAEPAALRAILVEEGGVDESEYVQSLAKHLGIPYLAPDPAMVQPEALSVLPPELLDELNALPIMMAEGWLTIAVQAFDDPIVLERIEKASGCQLQVIASAGEEIRAARDTVFERNGIDIPTAVSTTHSEHTDLEPDAEDAFGVEVLEEQTLDEEDLTASSGESPVIRLVNRIIREAAIAGASDIHIEPHDKEFRTRYRVDGELREIFRTPMQMLPAVISRIKILSGLDISQRRLPQDGGMSVRVEGRAVDLRVSTMATKFGEKSVMRLVERDAKISGLDMLGFEPQMLTRLRGAAKQPNGIVLVTGPTGSGKSTTLYAILSELLSEKRNISTVEDPVERKLLGANQFQVNVPAGFTFPAALRSLLRQDPDVLMVGEIRDNETARLAMEAALTGHLVLSTLHTNDALTAVPRLINMGVEPYLVAASLRAVLAQRLVRQLCPHCKEPVALNEGQSEILCRLYPDRQPLDHAYHSPGCQRCRRTGCVGRAGVFELLTLDESMLSCVVRDDGTDRLRDVIRSTGQRGMLDDGLDKVAQGIIGLNGLLEVLAPVPTHQPASALPTPHTSVKT